MNFRLLSRDEMDAFDEDFKHYLIVNGVSNEAWVEMNKNNPEKAQQIVEIYSDIVFQKIYEKVKFLEFRSKNQLLVFSCEKEQIHLIGLGSDDENVDFTDEKKINQSIQQSFAKIKHFKQSKKYTKKREIELFEMAEKGCIVSTQAFWDKIKQLTSV